MKILHILDHSLPLHSGYVFRTLGILGAQRELGWDTIHLTSPKQTEHTVEENRSTALIEEEDGWRFHRTPGLGGFVAKLPGVSDIAGMIATYRRLKAVICDEKPDILHAHSPVLNALPALWAGRCFNLPVVYEIRAFWEDAAVDLGTTTVNSLRYKATRSLETYAVKHADAVMTICEGLKRDLVARDVAPGHVTIIPNAVDIEHFPVLEGADEKLRAELGVGDARVLGFAGSFYSYEGLDLLIEALPRILEFQPDTKVLLVGGGPMEESLRAKVAALDLESRVIFTGRVPHDQVARYYSLMDLLVFPRRSIRLTELVTPLKPLESMAQKIICIASDVGGHKELVKDGDTGYLFAADDPDALASCVQKAFDAEGQWSDIRHAGRAFVENKRNWNASISNYQPVYEALLKG
jgi:PEP-CTERM/exosortase A-associated glycosyltransferase